MTEEQRQYLCDWQRKCYQAGLVACDFPDAYGGGGHTGFQRIANQEHSNGQKKQTQMGQDDMAQAIVEAHPFHFSQIPISLRDKLQARQHQKQHQRHFAPKVYRHHAR